MFEKFGEMGTYEEINELAENLLKEGDKESVRALCKENGIDPEMAEAFIEGEINFVCDAMSAAIGKLDIEAAQLKTAEIMTDWIDYIKAQCMEKEEVAKAVRSKGKTLREAIAALLKWSFKNQVEVDRDIMKAAGVSASKCTLGIPGQGTAKRLMNEYYLGGAQ